MRTRIAFIGGRMEGALASVGTPIVLTWNAWPAGAVRDPVTNTFMGTPTTQREEIKALLHFVSATASVRQFAEIQQGDCIADISPKVVLQGRDGLSFLLPTGPNNGWETWMNRPLSSELAVFWNAMHAGVKVFQTVLLRKAT
jgi:hypothetical protein